MGERKIAFFDIDRTVYDGYIIFPLVEHLYAGKIINKGTVDRLYQDFLFYRSKKIDYETSVENFNKHFAQGLKKHSPDAILAQTTAFLNTEKGSNFFDFVQPLFELLKRTHDIYFVTGELQFVGEAVANRFSVQGYISSEIEVRDGIFTGEVCRSLARRKEKSNAIEYLLGAHLAQDSMAFGDSEGDTDMLDKVDYAFCVNATEGVTAIAESKNWKMVTPASVLDAVKRVLL